MPYLFCLLFILFNSLYAQQVKLFDSSLQSFQNVRDFCIASNQTEAYFTIQSPNQDLSQIVRIQLQKGKWSKPELLPFCDAFMYLEPFLSYDGLKLFFASNRPLSETDTIPKDFDIWYVERINSTSKWSKPINLGEIVNTKGDEFYPTLSENLNLYFTMDSQSGMGKDDIYFAQWNGKSYSKPSLLNSNINSEGYEFNAFISKDESFLLYTKYNAKDGLGSGDLYIARRNINGEWQQAKNLGNTLNTKYMEYCPFYDAETSTLYFTSKRNSLQPKKFKTFSEFEAYIQAGENGLSKIYSIKMQF